MQRRLTANTLIRARIRKDVQEKSRNILRHPNVRRPAFTLIIICLFRTLISFVLVDSS